MPGLKSYVLGGATFVCALGIGYVMQYGFNAPRGKALVAPAQVEVVEITDVSSGAAAPRPDVSLVPRGASATLLPQPVAATEDLDTSNLPAGFGKPRAEAPRPAAQSEVAAAQDCKVTLDAEPGAGAMVNLTLNAPCHPSDRVTIHHMGMMFTTATDAAGLLSIRVPALAEQAVMIASFADGTGATANAEVSSLAFYDRVAVQWQGPAGLQLHAREFTSGYFGPGHIWHDATGDLAAAAIGEGGFLVRLGNAAAPEARMAEVYTFPTGTAKQAGEVLLTVEAEITPQNCSKAIEAQTLELRGAQGIRTRDLVVDMPGCDTIGDFLVLKNLIENLTIAAR